MSDRTKDTSYFLLGIAVGAVIGYFLNSDKVDEVMADLKIKAQKIKDDLDEQLGKGRDFIEHLSNKAEETIDNL